MPNQTNYAPIFVRANVRIHYKGREHVFLNQQISTYGLTGMEWPHSDPSESVGQECMVIADILVNSPFQISAKGTMTSEYTVDKMYLGIKLDYVGKDRERLEKVIAREGYYPKEYLRKFPRIPAHGMIPDMPMHAIVTQADGQAQVYEIGNISPGGILLFTENPNAVLVMPGANVGIQIEPRGSLFVPFKCRGTVRRQLAEKHENRNVIRLLGVQFDSIPAQDREAFLLMLKSVLESVKTMGLVKK